MAVYKNREVSIVSPSVPSNTNVEVISVSYANGMRDHVPLNQVYFTEDEKKTLLKDNPSKFENVLTISESDLKLIREGVEPSPKAPILKVKK